MKVKTQQGAAKAKDTREQASRAISDAQRQARSAVRDARRQARRQVFRARVAAAKARAGGRAKTSGTSTKAVGAAGAAGFAAGYFLDPESGKRRRDRARDRALSLIRGGKIEAGMAKGKSAPEQPAADDKPTEPEKVEINK
jgi:hypothetical protein